LAATNTQYQKLARNLFNLEAMRRAWRQIHFHLRCSSQLMKLVICFIIAVGLGLTSTVFADSYAALVTKGYRWVSVHGPYASTTEEGVRRIIAQSADKTELQMVQAQQAYYLIPGTIAQILKEDPAVGMSEIRLGGLTTTLWTYTRFLSRHPIQDIYGTIETPENSGLISRIVPIPTLTDQSTAHAQPNGNP
jgi:hypothetical protein